jgi:hypothetical protein
MYRSSRFLPALATVALAATLGACGSDDSADDAADVATLPPAACDAYSAVGAAMFGDPSAIADASVTLAAEAPEELRDAAATYGNAFAAAFDGDEAAMESPEFVAAGHQLGAAAFETCDSVEQLDVTGVDFGFDGLPDEIDAGRVAIRFTNGTVADEQHELVLMKKADGVTETAVELLDLPEEDLMSKIVPVAVVFADEAGGESAALVDLDPGSYVAICMIPTSGDGPPHAMNGMIADLEVV